ncbi:hypothetical protein BH20ACT2_BH20ACT2_15770 [soil metagenome]
MTTTTSGAPRPDAPPDERPAPRHLVDVVALVVLTVLVRLPAYFAERHLTFDDANFGASAIAMRAGGVPFREVFSSQGPLFLPLVWLGDLVGLRTLSAPRTLNLLAGVLLVLVAHHLARRFTDRAGALLAAGLVAVTGSVLWVTTPVAADGPAVAFGALAIALALPLRTRPSTARAVAVGLAAGAALCTKALLVSAVVPVAVVLLAIRRPRLLLIAAGTSIALFGGLAVLWGVGDVVDQSITYHLEKAGERTPGANAAKIASTLSDRDLPVLGLGGIALILGVVGLVGDGRKRRERLAEWGQRLREPSLGALLVVWWLATLTVLLIQVPLWRPYLAHLVVPSALLVARFRPPWKVVGLVLLVTLPYHVVHLWDYLSPPPYGPSNAALIDELQALPDGALVISDDTGLVWWAGRRTPDDLVDPSFLRIEAGQITAASVAADAAAPKVCAVVTWSDEHFLTFDDLGERLADAGYDVAKTYPGGRVLYLRPGCEPARG